MAPRIDPCGTPEVAGKGLDIAPNIVTSWDRLCRYDCSHVSRFPQHHTDLASLGVSRVLLCQSLLTCPDILYQLVLLYPALCQFSLELQQAGLLDDFSHIS